MRLFVSSGRPGPLNTQRILDWRLPSTLTFDGFGGNPVSFTTVSRSSTSPEVVPVPYLNLSLSRKRVDGGEASRDDTDMTLCFPHVLILG